MVSGRYPSPRRSPARGPSPGIASLFALAAALIAPGRGWAEDTSAPGSSGPAASTSASSSACVIELIRAPAEVAEVVQQWVGAEPVCTRLTVRIIPTEGGLYVLATAPDGRTWDRIVPDAQTAGVLVASWAADGTVSAPGPSASSAASTVASVTPETVSVSPPALAPVAAKVQAAPPRQVRVAMASPEAAPGLADAGSLTRATPRRAGTRSVRATVLVGPNVSALLAVDVVAVRSLRFGLALGSDAHTQDTEDGSAMYRVHSREVWLAAHAAWEVGISPRFDLRSQVAAALVPTRVQVDVGASFFDEGYLLRFGLGLGVEMTARLGHDWRVAAGPHLTLATAGSPIYGMTPRVEARLGLGLGRTF